MLELIKTLSGHSGCNLNLYRDCGKIFLRKDAGNPNYNRRLKKQFIKQQHFDLTMIKTPQIFNYGINKEGLFYFDMEYINGMALSEYMNQIKIKEIVDLIDLLFASLPINQAVISDKAQHIFQNKFNELSGKLDNQNQGIAEALQILKNYDFSLVPYSPCCGDLTLENIIVSSKGIYVIDLLDSFYNSWMIDVAKLLQDVELKWSYRKQKTDFGLNLRLATAKQALTENILSMKNGYNNLLMIYHILLLNVLRIYPYSKDSETLSFLNNALETVMTDIKEMKEK